MKIHVVPSGGKYHCPQNNCNSAFDKLNSLRQHCKRRHDISVSTYTKKSITIEERRERQRYYTARYRARKNKNNRRLRARKKIHTCFSIDDANERGSFGCRDPILEYKKSNIEGAGNGIFALEDLEEGDYVSWVSGHKSTTIPDDYSYTISMENGFVFNGIKTPIEGEGMASFVNREERTLPRSRKNCFIARCFGEKHELYLEIIKPIKAGQELFTTYSRGYRIKKKDTST